MSDDIEDCGEVKDDGSICQADGKYDDGKCGHHSEFSDSNTKGNEKHGLYKSEYYDDQPEKDKEFIDAIADDLLEKSRYNEDDESMVEKCRQIAIDLHQKRRADGYISRKGMTQENTVGIHEDYGEITETQENTLFITKDRLSRESRLSMKDLGILDEDNSKTEQTAESLIESLSGDME